MVLTCVIAAWLLRRFTLHLLPPSLALTCTEQLSKKRSYAVDKNWGLFAQILEKCPFRVFILGLLIRGVMMISEPASNLLTKVLQFHYGKEDPFCPSACSLFHSPRYSFYFGADVKKQYPLS